MPFPENAPRIHDLPHTEADEIAKLHVAQLADLQRELRMWREEIDDAASRLQHALELRYGERAATARRDAGKETGTVRLGDGDMTVIADLPKKVEWDQDRLAEIVARIRASGDDPAQYVDIAIKVPERKYTVWPESIRAEFTPARTVRTGKPVFRITDDGEAR